MREVAVAGTPVLCFPSNYSPLSELLYASGCTVFKLTASESEQAFSEEEEITALWAADSTTVVCGTALGGIRRHDLRSGETTLLHTCSRPILALSAFGGVVVFSAQSPKVTLVAGAESTDLHCSLQANVQQIAFAPTGRFVCAMDEEGKTAIFAFGTWETVHECCVWTEMGMNVPRLQFAWSTETDCIALPGRREIAFLDCSSLAVQHSQFRSAHVLVALSWLQSSRLLAVLTAQSALHLWNIATDSILCSCALERGVTSMVTAGEWCACAGGDGRFVLVARGDMHLAAAKVAMAEGDLCSTAIGAAPQEPKLAYETAEQGTVLFRSLLGTIVRSKKQSTIDKKVEKYFAVDVIFSKTDFGKNLHFADTSNICMAHMSETGAVFASKAVGELGDDDFVEEDKMNRKALVLYKPFHEGIEWTFKLPGTEDVQGVASGRSWCAVLSSLLFIRILSARGGVQYFSLSFPTPIVSLATHRDVLGILCHSSIPASGAQRLSTHCFDVSGSSGVRATAEAHLGLPAGTEVSWFGFTSDGVVACCDSTGVVRLLDSAMDAWAAVASVPQWTVVGISAKEVFGFKLEERKFLSRVSIQQLATCKVVPSDEIEKALRIPSSGKLDDDFLTALNSAITNLDATEISTLISSLALPLDQQKCFKLLQKLKPKLVPEVTALLNPEALKRKLPAEQDTGGKRAKLAQDR